VRRLRTASRRLVCCVVLARAAVLVAQAQPAAQNSRLTPEQVSVAATAEPSSRPAPLVFFNRSVTMLRARVLGREPAERADSATRALDELADSHVTGPVESRPFQGGAFIVVAGRTVFALTSADVDQLSGETVDGAAATAVDHIRLALAETVEARTPRLLIRAAAIAAAVCIAGLLLLWVIHRGHRYVEARLAAVAEQTVARSGLADVDAVRASRLLDIQHWILRVVALVLELAIVYAMAAIVLRRFPYTRAWGESMRSFLLTTLETLGLGAANAVPGLVTVVIIFFAMRFVVRLVALYFNAVEQGRITPRWIYPETAQPTRRLLTGLVWLLAIVVAYPYLPGSQTEAFKGVSVFVGLMFTLGSSGLVNQIMSSFMITYSRALRVGDYVRIGEVEGTVTQVGMLSTKVRTPWREEVTIPNTVVVATQTTDYSRLGDTVGTFIPTSVTIGYDAPWRQVQSLLLMAAERTPGIRREPAPMVLQMGLEDFYVKYTLFVCLERQEMRPYNLHTLHANIQDLFNEYGVQIMSPNYVFDPAGPKVVAKKDWFAAPARVEGDGAPSV